jgi:hypothetical protein
MFYVLLKNISLIWRRHHYRWRAAKFRPMLRAFKQGGIFIVPHLAAVTQDLGFSGLIRKTAPFNRLLRLTRGSWGPILTRILTGCQKISLNSSVLCIYALKSNVTLFVLDQGSRRVWPMNRGCLLLHGTWSHLWYVQRSVYAHSLICISCGTYEIDYWWLFLSFHQTKNLRLCLRQWILMNMDPDL